MNEHTRRNDMKILPRFRLRAVAVVPVAALLALAAAGCGGSSSTSMQKGGVAGASHSTSTVIVKTRKVKGKVILVNSKGHTLYVFMHDKRKRVTCTTSSGCASVWPPLKQKGMHKATARGAAKQALIGSDKNPGGGRVVTYSKWPLYTYSLDSGAGMANGEGKNLNGGRWYVISPSGKLIKSFGSGGGGGTTTSSWA
jgi:predicted lipoprotein with Yx(FWY)xxD motif